MLPYHAIAKMAEGQKRRRFWPPALSLSRPNTSDDPCRNNRSCNLPSKPFFTITPDNLPYFLFFRAVNPLFDRLALRRIHTHIERAIEAKTEAAFLFIQLR